MKEYLDLSFIMTKYHIELWTISQFETRKLRIEKVRKESELVVCIKAKYIVEAF